MADEGQRLPTPEEFAEQYLSEHPEGETDLPIEAETVDVETQVEPEVEAPALPNPFEMSKEERREWLRTASKEEKAQAAFTYGNPDDIILLTSDYSREKNELASARKRLEEDRDTLMKLLQQQAQAPAPPPAVHPEAPAYDPYGQLPQNPIDPYAPPPDPAVIALQQQVEATKRELDAIKQQQQQAQIQEGERSIRNEMESLTREHPWFTEADYDALRYTMQQSGIPSATVVFRNVFFDRLMDEAATKRTVPTPEAQVAPSAPVVPVPPTAARKPAQPGALKTLASPEEFARSVIATGNAKGVGD